MIGGMTKTPTMSVRFEQQGRLRRRRRRRRQASARAGAEVTFSTVLGDDALDGLRAQGSAKRRRRRARRSSTRRGRPPTRTPSSPAATPAEGRHARQPLDLRHASSQQLDASRSRDTPADVVVFSDFRHGIFNRDTIPPLTEAIPTGRVPRRRQPGRQPLGQHPRVPRLRPDHAERARGALRARRSGLGRAAAGARALRRRPTARR